MQVVYIWLGATLLVLASALPPMIELRSGSSDSDSAGQWMKHLHGLSKRALDAEEEAEVSEWLDKRLSAEENESPDKRIPPFGLNKRIPPFALNKRIPPFGLNKRIPPFGLNKRIPPFGMTKRIPPFGLNKRIPPFGLNKRIPPFALNKRIPPFGLNKRIPPFGLNKRIPPFALNKRIPPFGLNKRIPPFGLNKKSSESSAFNEESPFESGELSADILNMLNDYRYSDNSAEGEY